MSVSQRSDSVKGIYVTIYAKWQLRQQLTCLRSEKQIWTPFREQMPQGSRPLKERLWAFLLRPLGDLLTSGGSLRRTGGLGGTAMQLGSRYCVARPTIGTRFRWSLVHLPHVNV